MIKNQNVKVFLFRILFVVVIRFVVYAICKL